MKLMKWFGFVTVLCAAIIIAACEQPQTESDAAGDQAQMDSLITAYEAAWENRDAAAFDEILAPGYTRSVNAGEGYGIDSVKQMATSEQGLQNISIELEEVVYGENTAAVSWTLTGTINDQSVETTGASFVTFEEGKIASDNVVLDTAPLMPGMGQSQGGMMQEQDGMMPDTTM